MRKCFAIALLAGCTTGPSHSSHRAGVDADGDGFESGRRDCDDSDPAVHPGAFEAIGDGIDQDCDGLDGPDPLGGFLLDSWFLDVSRMTHVAAGTHPEYAWVTQEDTMCGMRLGNGRADTETPTGDPEVEPLDVAPSGDGLALSGGQLSRFYPEDDPVEFELLADGVVDAAFDGESVVALLWQGTSCVAVRLDSGVALDLDDSHCDRASLHVWDGHVFTWNGDELLRDGAPFATLSGDEIAVRDGTIGLLDKATETVTAFDLDGLPRWSRLVGPDVTKIAIGGREPTLYALHNGHDIEIEAWRAADGAHIASRGVSADPRVADLGAVVGSDLVIVVMSKGIGGYELASQAP